MPKIARDLAILIAFCGAFYLLVVFVRGESTDASSTSNFSLDRITGDRLMSDEKWDEAIPHFERIAEQDQYNGLAVANICRARIALLNELYFKYLEKSERVSFSDDQKKSMKEEVDARAENCLQPLERLANFDEHKSRALRKIAALHCFLGNDKTAVDYLKKYIQSDDPHGLPIYRDGTFDTLRYLDEFQQLIQLEELKYEFFQLR